MLTTYGARISSRPEVGRKELTMTRKDYELIAKEIWRAGYVKDGNQVRQQAKESMRKLIAIGLAVELEQDNPKFDQNKFLIACGLETQAAYVNSKGKTVDYS